MIDVTEKLEKELEVRIVRLPEMNMIKSPAGNPEEPSGALQDFHSWAMETLLDGDEVPYGGRLPIFSWNTEQGLQFIIKKPDGFVNEKNGTSLLFKESCMQYFPLGYLKYSQNSSRLKNG